MTENKKYSPLQKVLIALAIVLISYVPVRTIYNMTMKASVRAEGPAPALEAPRR